MNDKADHTSIDLGHLLIDVLIEVARSEGVPEGDLRNSLMNIEAKVYEHPVHGHQVVFSWTIGEITARMLGIMNTASKIANERIRKTHLASAYEIIYEFKVSGEVSSPQFSIPPQIGERILLLILTKDERINIPGDLAEEFAEIATKHGARFAKVWYYKQVAASAWPMIYKALRFGLYMWIGEWIRQRIK